ncbi:polyketide synthase 3 [Xylaria scruposa]|nr:polyketide synthase 3 [Xylaria scruposa]
MYEPVAIVGTACRFPGGSASPSKLWSLLQSPRDVLKEFPLSRLGTSGFYDSNGDMRGRSNVLHKSYLLDQDVRHFDNGFFHINPKEAADMDPQQRILLETVYEAFESAGWSLSDVNGSLTSVHVGVMTDDYSLIQSRDPEALGGHAATGVSRSILANRLSYVFNLRGASLALDTACSSSLVALHMAAQCLQRGEATQAVVAGTNLLLDSSWYIMGSSMHMISPESRCRMWDKDATGYARGEGCAAVVLKTLSQAVRDHDHIECIIRGTGVNSDGQGSGRGITIPSPAAQTSLIQQTYRDAGLDPVRDRCQYFECHGTGTQAGDPAEAQAIRDAFRDENQTSSESVLFCGSVKTVIGHLEGCAGLAGLIKASLAIQNKAIPPNMHFNQLNPKIEPFYGGLEVPTSLLAWPDTGGGPRRASVNSFGFGGTNAHAILESYEPPSTELVTSKLPSGIHHTYDEIETALAGPFVFSARSRVSLVDWLKSLLNYLRVTKSVDLDSLSNTLHSKRSVLGHRVAIPAVVNRDGLMDRLADQINILSSAATDSLVRPPSASEGATIMGVFTGQGAQAARMGFALLRHCRLFRDCIMECEAALSSIPDPPTWSLTEELSANAVASHVATARFSQPLCTALQIGLVDLLHVCGIRFRAVVGHSSGEIAAAYASGLLTKRDAMGIAYYRGCVSNLARGEEGQSGGMLAASVSFSVAAALCDEPRFRGRISVAASNSPSSVTMSGDNDAVMQMKSHLDEKQIQARALQVDTAYHSHHMRACAESYLSLLKNLNIKVRTPPADQECRWYSSVRQDVEMLDELPESEIEAQYWVDNLMRPVLFSEAVKSAARANTAGFTAAIEVGPHGTLKGPVNQTLNSINSSVPYMACLIRGKNAIEAISEAIANIWSLVPSSVEFSGWRTAFGLVSPKPPLKDLPPYAWDHTQPYWRESRVARNYRLDTRPPHHLLGRVWSDSGSEQTWRNTLRVSEMPWLRGHVFQNQILFPATGYISMAVDAAKAFVKNQSIKLVEVRDMSIPTALPINEADEVEILFAMRSRGSKLRASSSILEAEFTCHSYPNNSLEADRNCEGTLIIHLGVPEPTDLAPTFISQVELIPCHVDRFYKAASEIGFQYSGLFRALDSLNKCWGHAKAVAAWSSHDPDMNVACTLHPAVLDISFQTGLSTILSAAERSMQSPYLPVGVKRAIIDPNQNFNNSNIVVEAYLTRPTVGLEQLIETDINIKASSNQTTNVCEIQIESVTFKAISEPQPSEDRNIIAKTVWGRDVAHGLRPPAAVEENSSTYAPVDYERVSLFYLQRIRNSVTEREIDTLQPYQQKLIRCIDRVVSEIRNDGDRASLRAEWLNDTSEMIKDLLKRDPSDVDMALLASGADQTQSLLKDGSNDRDHSLTSLYRHTTWGKGCRRAIADMVAQVSHTFPRANILHLCGGGGVETVPLILDAVGDAYASYIYAGASQDIVDELRDQIGLDIAKEKRLSFEVLDLNTTSLTSGGPNDIVIVTDICRARPDVPERYRVLRSLLRPGGFLIAIELTGTSLQPTVILGCYKGWWENGRLGKEGSGPGIMTGEWDNLLSNNGFSGIDCIFHDQHSPITHGYSVLCAQAMDDRMEILRNPLFEIHQIKSPSLVFIGGETNRVSKLIREGRNLLRNWAHDIQVWSRFDQIDSARLPTECSVINLQDLDKPLFASPPLVNELKNLKEVLGAAKNIVWVTSGRLLQDPYANIMIGIGRSLRHEHIYLNLQFLDFDEGEPWDVHTPLAQLIRMIFSNSSPDATQGMLWVQEQEIVVRDSQMWTPRVLLDSESNKTFNAARRRVTKTVDHTDAVEVVHETSQSILACSRSFNSLENHVRMEVQLSIALHANDETPRYLSYGRVGEAGSATELALSHKDSSLVAIHKNTKFSSCAAQGLDAMALAKVATFLIASNLVARMPSSGTTLVCGASDWLAEAISALAADAGRKVMFVAISETPLQMKRAGWIYVHPWSLGRAMKKSIPRDATALVQLSGNDAAYIFPCLPSSCTAHVFDVSSLSQESLDDALKNYGRYQDILSSMPMPKVVALSSFPQKRIDKLERLSVVTDWSRASQTNAIIRGLDPRTLLSPNKTYFLVGMAGELGQSLAYFLVRSGARYIVLSSRNPKGEQNWLRDLRTDGIDIRVVKMDVTDRAQVRQTVDMLRRTMPKIGGVTNAALVLEPAVFANLSAASIAKQMMPKIHGTMHLDEVFGDERLDFFMCFGSLGTVFGNPGHAIYHAGNSFMLSLVANRKRRGLAGSILNFGMLVDVGYVARADRSAGSNVEEWLRTDGVMPLSEADFHHVVLQGIATGRPQVAGCEVIMGVETFYDRGQTPRPRWVNTPTFSHMVRLMSKAPSDDEPSSGSQKSKLENASTINDAIPPIAELLSQKLQSMIHVSLDSIHPDEPFSRLGIDSINAIEIRKWFWERLRVEIAMVKILGRDSSASIIRTAAEQYLAKRPAASNNVIPPKGGDAIKERESRLARKAQANEALIEIATDVTTDDQSRPTVISRNQSPRDSKASTTSSEIASESQSTLIPTSNSSGEIVRSEPLSIAQAGLFYIYAFSDRRTTLNVTTRWRIDGPLDVEKLGRAFDRTVNRYDALRTCFFATADSSEIQQHVTRTKALRLTQVQSTVETRDIDVQRVFDRIKEHVYALETGDTVQVTLVRHDAQQHTLVLGFHNLVVDVVSISIILRDIAREYQSQSWSRYSTPASYFDYTRQEMDNVQAGRFDANIEYWINHLDPLPSVLPLLPVAKVRNRPSRRAYGYHENERDLSSEFVQSVTKISQTHGGTPMQFYLAALQVFICRLLTIDDVVIGVLHMGRDPISPFRETVGHLASILPIRFQGVLGSSYPHVMKNTRATLLSSLEHANIPFAYIVDRVRPAVSEANMPLIQVAYDYTVDDSLPGMLGECTIAVEEVDFTTLYDLVLNVRQSVSGGHVLNVKCSDDFYSASATRFIAETFFGVLEGLARDPLTEVKDCRLFSDAQLNRARTLARGPAPQNPWSGSLVERFRQVAVEFPDSIAVKDGSETITYSQLAQKAELYVGILIDATVTSGKRIAVFCRPSIDLYAIMLAVFWIGAIFVPLDVSVPAARRNDIIKVCKPYSLVFHAVTAEEVVRNHADISSEARPLNITQLAGARAQKPHTVILEPPSINLGSDSLILFTSGSTGVPKGIRLHQRGFMNYTVASSQQCGFGPLRVLQQTSIGFDISLAQVYHAFVKGGTLVTAPVESRGDPEVLSKLIVDEKIEYTFCTPSEYSLLLTYAPDRLKQCTQWRFASTAGEVLPQRLVNALRELKLPHLRLTNWYGPTEVTGVTGVDIPLRDDASNNDDQSKDEIGSLIGRVLPGSSIYITSEHDGSLMPPGMPGEICVGGTMVANGYLDPTMSEGIFVENPFAATEDVEQGFATMYRTGDSGYAREDGSIVFLGRTQRGSTMVKLRGLRIDLTEVSGAVMEAAPDDLADAAVTARGDPPFLVCHVAFKPGRHLGYQQLMALLKTLPLPQYMIPAAIVALDKMPLVPNGKLDLELLRRLPLPTAHRAAQAAVGEEVRPQSNKGKEEELTLAEEKLRALWIDVVGVVAETADIGLHTSFLAVGGNSFLLVRLQHAIQCETGCRVPIPQLKQAADLRDMARQIERARTEE